MKNIFLAAAASIGLSATADAQKLKTAAQYKQEILNVFVKAVKDGKVSGSPFHMKEGDECYAFDRQIAGTYRQVYYCKDTESKFIEAPKLPKDQEEQAVKQLLDAITQTYPE